MGLQQCADQGRRPVEGRVQNKPRTFRTLGDVFRPDELPSDLPNDDERIIQGPHRNREGGHLYG